MDRKIRYQNLKGAFSLFEILLEKIKIDIIKYLFNLNIVIQENKLKTPRRNYTYRKKSWKE